MSIKEEFKPAIAVGLCFALGVTNDGGLYDIGSAVIYSRPSNVYLPPDYTGTVRIGTNVIWPKP